MNEDIFEYILSPKKILIMKTQLERSGKAMKLQLNKRTVYKLTGGLASQANGFIYTITETGHSTIVICTVAETYQTSRTGTRTGN